MTEKETTHQMLMELIKEECKINTKANVEYPPSVLSLGETTIKTKNGDLNVPTTFASLNNQSVITAPPKTKKTFFISLLASVYLSGQNKFGGNLKGHRENKDCIHFDTEQGIWHSTRVAKRILQMSSSESEDNYKTFALRTINYKQRLEFIEYVLKANKDKNGLILVDGVADLVQDSNDIISSSECVQKLMEFSARYNCHIMVVIHQNFGSAKLGTGHLGSFLEKKAETVIQLETNTVNKDWITVKCKRSRGYAFETFSFKVNDIGLPEIVGDLYNPLKGVSF